ncbi:MAG: DUF2786 domain-containing protein [Actinobacteria bacterium]|nr:DUF2786 domain-containing protein [Actinomycetota bacterium]
MPLPPDNQKMLAKVQALLAKAESTPFAEEAAAFIAKAQELMTRHAIDDAMAAAGPRHRDEKPTLRAVAIPDPYKSAKVSLLAAVAGANDVRVVTGREDVTLVGFASDVAVTEVLFASLLVQATREMHLAAARITDGRLRAFRHAFFVAYGSRIGTRLEEARRASTVEAASAYGTALVPVMAQRVEAVESFMDDTWPSLRTKRPTLSHRGGWLTGHAAADRADLGAARLEPTANS